MNRIYIIFYILWCFAFYLDKLVLLLIQELTDTDSSEIALLICKNLLELLCFL